MYNLLCDWYVIGLVIYITVVVFSCVLQVLIYKFGSGNEFDSALLCCAVWFLVFADFVWGIINCFTEGKLFIGIFIILMGIGVFIINFPFIVKINRILKDR